MTIKKLEDPNFKFSLEQLFAMYTNVSYLGLLKDVAKKDSIEVARALLKKIGTEKNANLAITKFGCDFQRRAFFESFRDIDYSNAMQVVINYNKNSSVPPISFSLIKRKPQILDVAKCDQLSSSLDQVQINKELIEYSSGQKDVYHELSEPKHAKESCATIIARNSLCNYTPFFAFLLQKNSEKFFEMAEKTDLLWNMVQNQN